jgi:hypothetical protein
LLPGRARRRRRQCTRFARRGPCARIAGRSTLACPDRCASTHLVDRLTCRSSYAGAFDPGGSTLALLRDGGVPVPPADPNAGLGTADDVRLASRQTQGRGASRHDACKRRLAGQGTGRPGAPASSARASADSPELGRMVFVQSGGSVLMRLIALPPQAELAPRSWLEVRCPVKRVEALLRRP